MTDHPHDQKYYQYLEDLRQTGATNMFGASPYLAAEFYLGDGEARDILVYWISNYDQLVTEGVIEREEVNE